MVGGTTPPQSDSGEISRVLVLNLLWQSKRCSRTAQDISVLTTPSLLSRGTPVHPDRFWQARFYDFNVWTERKRIEKLRYIHRNPVKRGLVESPEQWAWSSFRHYISGVEGMVEIESQWTARKRERSAWPSR